MRNRGVGAVVADVVAWLVLRFFLNYLQKHGFRIFGFYRIILGIVMLILLFTGVIHNN